MGNPGFFQTTSTTKRKVSPKFFRITVKTRQAIPEILLKYWFKNKIHEVSKILTNYFKNETRNTRDSFKLLQKPDIGVPEILSNYCKNKTKDTPDSFKPLRKQTTMSSRDFFKLLQKHNSPVVSEIYSNWVLQKQDKISPRFFEGTSKAKYTESSRFSQITVKALSRDVRDTFKLIL